MIRGTTAQFKFKLPYSKNELAWITIKFWQPNNPTELLPIIKKLTNCYDADDSKGLCVSLTAEETSRFLDKYKAKVQFRAQHIKSGTIFGIKPRLITVYPMPDDVIEESPDLPSESEEEWIVLNGGEITETNLSETMLLDAMSVVN